MATPKGFDVVSNRGWRILIVAEARQRPDLQLIRHSGTRVFAWTGIWTQPVMLDSGFARFTRAPE
ncbi:MAG TPA: hypothetical protein VGO49_11680 [Bradyrhizobium sp.]|nr:hypothetical protein [Bradyrhizobium sp.]